MAYAQPRTGEWDTLTPLGFWNTNGSPNLDQTTRLKIINNKKRTCRIVDFAVLADHRVKSKESKKNDKFLDLVRELKKKTVEHESDGDTNCNWCSWISTGPWGLGNNRKSGDHPNFSIIQIGQNTEKSPGDLIRLTVIQTPVKDHQLTLMWKTLSE